MLNNSITGVENFIQVTEGYKTYQLALGLTPLSITVKYIVRIDRTAYTVGSMVTITYRSVILTNYAGLEAFG